MLLHYLYLQLMKEKRIILNSFLTLIVLLSILFQYGHSYKHAAQQLSEKKCSHKYNSSQEITHQHKDLENCFICNFRLSTPISSNISVFEFKKIIFPSGYTVFNSREITQFFKGSLFALRAPPFFIV